jgi:glucose-6-phosphate 1-dehydrogenase
MKDSIVKEFIILKNGVKMFKNPSLVFTIFGSTGDLTYRKLLPALYHLKHRGRLNEDYVIRCIGRKDYTKAEYVAIIEPWIKKQSRFTFNQDTFDQFVKQIEYIKMEFTKKEAYTTLLNYPIGLDNLYYFAVAPEYFNTIADGLDHVDYLDDFKHRVILEKPFGDSLIHAKMVNEHLTKLFNEENIYHIDHYLGKEMIQNILAIRFGNRMFESVWNSDDIEQIQITASETVGVETRGSYYEQAGATKDMMQNHLMQIMSYVLMERPESLSSHDMLEKQLKILDEIELDDLVLGQYDKNDDVLAYREESNVDAQSMIDTYVAVKVHLKEGQLKNVPIYLRTGKRLLNRATYIKIIFKSSASKLYENLHQEVITIKVQPDEGVSLSFNAKKPGTINTITDVKMDFCQSCILENRINTPEAYERLLDDAFGHDDTLFTPWPIVEMSWKFGESIRKFVNSGKQSLVFYPAKTWGPIEADKMLQKDGFVWLDEDELSY